MATRPTPPLPLLATADDCEAQFYEALQQADLTRLMALWADEEDIACIHPGGLRLVGAALIQASFAEIFNQGAIDCRPVDVRRVSANGVAVHTLSEEVRVMSEDGPQVGHVLASNVYVQTPLGWRIVLHHASPGLLQEGGGSPASTRLDAGMTLH
ncbi:MAG: hypothetical protein RL722_1896 [Pseudomonadota bacterium]|jgi:ketosteroid isomerase-like protein